MTVILQVVASPVVGKVLVVGLDRTIGTILGGVCGFASFLFAHKIWNGEYLPTYATLSVLTFFAAFGSVVIAWRLAKLETTPRLFTLTYVLVALGSMEPESTDSASRGRELSAFNFFAHDCQRCAAHSHLKVEQCSEKQKESMHGTAA